MNSKKIMLALLSTICVYSYADNLQNQSSSLSDNMITIKPGTHTQAENEAHQSYCASLGEEDITDKSTIKVGSGAKDPMNTAVLCQKSITKEEFEASQKANITSTWQGNPNDNPNSKKNNLIEDSTTDNICSVTAIPINGTMGFAPAPSLPNFYDAKSTYHYTFPVNSNVMLVDNTSFTILKNCNGSASSNLVVNGGYGQSDFRMECDIPFYHNNFYSQTWNNVSINGGTGSCNGQNPGQVFVRYGG